MSQLQRNNIPRSATVASVEQDAPSKVPILHPGTISPAVMREFQNGCLDYFDNKEVGEEKQVRKILPGLKDPRICDWVNTDRVRIQALTFDDFMTEFRAHGVLGFNAPDTRSRMLMSAFNFISFDYLLLIRQLLFVLVTGRV